MKLGIIFLTLLPLWANAQTPTDTVLANKYYAIGDSLGKHGKYDESNAYFQMAQPIYQQAEDWAKYLSCYNVMVINLIDISEFDSALLLSQRVLTIGQRRLGSEHKEIADAYENIGIINEYKGEYDLAIEYYRKALILKIGLFGKRHPNIARTYDNIGLTYCIAGKYDSALFYHQNAFHIRKTALKQFNPLLAISYNYIGIVYERKWELDRALFHYLEALKINKKLFGNVHPDISANYNNIGVVYQRKRELNQALAYYQQALKINKKLFGDMHRKTAINYNNIGMIYEEDNKLDQALLHYQQAFEISKKLLGRVHPNTVSIYRNIGVIHEKKGDLDQALAYYQQALEINKKLFGYVHPEIAYDYDNIGIVHEKKEELAQALIYYQQALKINKKLFGDVHPEIAYDYNHIGVVHEKKGELTQALAFYQQSIMANHAIFDDTITSVTPSLKGYMNSLLFLDALLAKVNMLKKIYESDTSSVLFNTIRATNQLCDSLINQLRQSFKTHQDKIALAKKAKQTYEGAISTHLLFDSTFSANETAFYYAEKSKVSTLAGVLMDLQAKKISNIPDSLLSQEQSLKDQRSLHQSKQQDAYLEGDSLLAQQHQNELFTVNQQYDSLIEAFEQQYPQYYQLKHNNEVISVETLQNQLSPETALLEYFMGDSATYAFTITNNSIHIATLPSDSTQQSQIQELRTLLSPEGAVQFNQQKYEQLATALYQTVVTPALDSLPTSITKLQIVPDGELGYLPFELLLTDNTSDADYRSLPYLMRDYVISYGYSATWLYQPFSRREQPVTQQYLAFAPSYENALTDSIQLLAVGRFRDQVLPLEWNQQEARAIDQHLSGQTYVGLEAQERYFKKQASQSQILHLAMHALVDDQNPMYSRLVFSPNPSDSVEDGFLNAYELYNMEIPADLAVLSACETGYGKLERGEGIMSLARAFAYAGCPSLVMSHWTVDDQSTAQLMGYFYELLADGLPKDEALHQAKLRFLDKTNIPTTHPFFWGSFVVMGDTSPITQPNNWTVWYYALSIISLLSITTVVYTRRKV